MKKRSVLFCIFVILFALSFVTPVNASQSSSSNYGTDAIFSDGGGNTGSANYGSGVSSGIISGTSSSSSYSQTTGFFLIPEEKEVAVSEETPSPSVTPSGGGGGAVTLEAFSVDRTLIKILIKQGESARELIEIKNNLDSVLNLQIESSLKKFMVISEENFSLAPKESKRIYVDIFAKEDEIPEAYTGKITITGNGESKIINLILEIKERKPLFDVSVDVISKKVPIEGNVKAKLKVSNLGDLNNIDIYLYYAIKDFDGHILSFKEENVAIDKELTVTRTLAVPSTASLGDYVFYFKASYDNISASSTESFEVVEKEAISLFLILLMICVVLIFIVLIFVIASLWRLRHHLREGRIERKTEKRIKKNEKLERIKPIKAKKIISRPKPERIGFFKRRRIRIERRRKERESRKLLRELARQKKRAEKENYRLRRIKQKEHEKQLRLQKRRQRRLEKEYQRKIRIERKMERKANLTSSEPARKSGKKEKSVSLQEDLMRQREI
jgi:hypothetical protein